MRKILGALCAVFLAVPAAFVVVVVLPATPAHGNYGENWWIDHAWGEENRPDYPNAEFRICPVAFSATSGLPFTVDYATSDITATAGADYVSTSGTLTFLPGVHGRATCQTVQVPILDDDLYEEGDDFWGETFRLDLMNPGLTAPPVDEESYGHGVIFDDHDDWPVGIVTDDKVVAEGGVMNVPVRLVMEKSYPITVHYETVSGSASASDFAGTSGNITFEPGEDRKYVPVPVTQDALNEAEESFHLVLSDNQPAHKTWIYRSSTNKITDDDPLPKLVVGDVSLPEPETGTAEALFDVSLTAPSGREVAVDFSTEDGSATAHHDYAPTAGTIAFPAGVTSQTVAVPVYASASDEGEKSFAMTLASPVNAALEREHGSATIIDSLPAPEAPPSEPVPAPAPAPTAAPQPGPEQAPPATDTPPPPDVPMPVADAPAAVAGEAPSAKKAATAPARSTKAKKGQATAAKPNTAKARTTRTSAGASRTARWRSGRWGSRPWAYRLPTASAGTCPTSTAWICRRR